MTRRSFLIGSSALTLGGCRVFTGSKGDWDDDLSVLLSDVHVNGVEGRPTYQLPRLEAAVAEILRHDPLPRRCLVLGDLAWIFGEEKDYAASRPCLRMLEDAGIEVVVTTGNHDHRRPMFDAYPEHEAATPVKGRVTRVVRMPHCDFILLDSLQETGTGLGSGNAVDGVLDEAQGEWLAAELKSRTKPVIVGAHHPLHELKQGGQPLVKLLAESPCVAGYIHGHDHRWIPHWSHYGYGKMPRILRTLCLPSTGHWGDIGYVWLRTDRSGAVAMLRQTDFFFPEPLGPDEEIPVDWHRQISEHQGASFTLSYGSVLQEEK